MTNFDIAQNALQTSIGSAGSAMKEHAKAMDSIELKLNSLKAAWQGFAQSFMDSSFLKDGIDALKSFVETLQWLIDNLGVVGTISLGTGITGAFKGIKESKNTIEGITNVISNVVNAASGASDAIANVASGASDAITDAASGGAEVVENITDITRAGTEAGDILDGVANAAGAVTDAASGVSEAAGAIGETTESIANLGNAARETGRSAGSAAGGFKKFFGTLAGKIAIAGAVVAALALIYNQYKKNKEAAAEARQKIIESSNAYLDAASNFEQAYIKYSGRTNLTIEEESELESAIQSTVNALDDKSSALQSAVNSSNDYIASLERIADAELKAAKEAAEVKRNNAAINLQEAIGSTIMYSGSSADILLENGIGLDKNEDAWSKESEIALEVGRKWFDISSRGKDGSQDEIKLKLSPNADVDEIVSYYDMLIKYRQALSDEGLGDSSVWKNVNDTIGKLSETVDVYISGVYEAVKANYQLSEGIPTTTEAYLAMREAILGSEDIKGLSLDTKMSILNSLDSDYSKVFDLSSAEAQARKFVGIIKGFGDGTKDGTNEIGTVETFLNMRTALNNNECTVGEYLSELDNITSMSEKFSDEEKKAFNLAFGIDTDSIKEQYEHVYNYIKRNYLDTIDASDYPNSINAWEHAKEIETERIRGILDNLSATELQAVANIKGEINWETTNTDEILAQIKDEAKFIEAMNYTISIDVETESLDALNSALSESVSGAGLSSDSITALKGRYAELASQGYDLSAMFEETSNGIHLNKNAVSEFEQALASQKLSETDGKLGVLKKRYDELTDEINNCTDAGERASLYSDQQEVAQKINDLATLASQYKGLTSAYNAWQNAESAGNERDMYENIISGFETIEDEISRGWYDDGTIKFLELMTGQTDLAGKSASELKEIWNSLDDTIKGTSYSVKDFFTTNKDGESTSTGAYNFLRAVEELGKNGGLKAIKDEAGNLMDISKLVERNADGKIVAFDFNVVGGDKAVAEALGVSEEMVQIIQRTLDDAGFVVTLDGKYTLLADLKTSAEEANNSLKKLQTEGLKNLKDLDLNFDFDVNTVEGYQEQLEKALNVLDKFRNKDGTLQTDKNGNLVKGAKEALEVAEYYTAAMDKLTEPKIMQIDTSTVDEELQDPIEKMQTIGDLCKEKHLVSLTGDTEEINKVQGEIDKVAKEIEKLDPEIKAKIGIDEDWDAKTIADKIEKGEIEVPAELKLDVQMSEDLKDMRLLMMRQLGLVSEEEVKLKVGYEIDESTVDNLTPDEQKVVVEFIAENEDWFDKLTDDEKKVAIELVTSGVDLDSLTDDEKKEIVVEFVTKNEDEFDKLSDEEKQVVVDIVTDDKALKALEEHGVEIEAFCNIFGVEKVDDLKKKLEQLDDEQILVLAEVLGRTDVEKLKTTVAGLDDKTVEAIAKALGEGDVEGLKTTINGLDDKTVQAIAEAFGYSSVEELNTAIGNLSPKTVQAIAQALGITDVDSLRAAIARLTSKDVDAVANVDGKDDVNGLKGAIDNLKGKTVTVWAQIKQKASSLWDKLTGGGGVDGTAHVGGTAFADGTVIKKSGKAYKQGDWGTKSSGVALGAELGPELLVRNGKWHLIGEDGAQFFGYKKGDIIFNADQTREIFERGKITHGNRRGKALVSGTAFGSGSGGGEEPTVTSITVGTNKNTGKSYTKSTDDSAKDFEETFDLIEIAIDRVERAIDQLDTKANSVYRSWSERNSNLTSEISKVSSEIDLQQRAYQEYMNAAAGVGLSSSWQAKIKNGAIDISTVKDEVLAEKIKDFQTYYEAALACKDAILELKETESKLYAQRFENLQTQYDGILQGYEHTEAMLNEYISQAEEQGYIVSKKYYEALITNEKQNINALKQEQAELIKTRDEAVASGKITKNSEAWLEQCAAIDEITQAIEESTTALLEFDNAMREIDWSVFDLIQERISGITEESDFLIELMSNKDLFDDNGKFTSQGLATLGLHAQNVNTHMYAADTYGEEVAKLDAQIAKDPYDQELINRRNELLELQRESILAAEQEKDAIKDLVENGIEEQLNSLQELIDKKNEALESERDLYEYQKKVAEQSKAVAVLEKELAAYSGDDSEEAKQKIQQIKVDLESARQDLQETEMDKVLEDTSALLDNLFLEAETLLNSRLDNVDALLEQVIETINIASSAEGNIATALGSEGAIAIAVSNNATSIKDTLTSETNKVGTTLSNAMNSIWNSGDGNAKSVLTMYGEDFKSKSATIITTLNGIKSSVNSMVSSLNKEATTKTKANKTTTSAKKNPTTSSSSSTTKKTTTTTKKASSGDGKPKIGDRVKYVSGQYYYDSQGKKPLGSHNKGEYVYITNINTRDWATHGYHISTGNKLGKGDLGWLKLNQLSGYASGKKNFLNDEVAWTQEDGREFIVRPSDGAILTPIAKGDSVLNAAASGNIWNMANSPAEFIKENLKLDASSVPNASNVNNSIVQNFENITFSMPNVHGYNELLREMQSDPKFEKLVLSMTIDQIAGRSKLAKGKSIR